LDTSSLDGRGMSSRSVGIGHSVGKGTIFLGVRVDDYSYSSVVLEVSWASGF
jgi:hypothetical protein